MADTQQQTAILIFANSSEKEVLEKSIPNGKALFDYLHHQTFKATQETGLPALLYSENLQRGDSFGERFANAIEDVFSKGYQQVITIGNDSPDLTTSDILDAYANLLFGHATIGPSIDGGTYLIGIHKDSFQKEAFTALPWQTPFLRQALHTYLKELNCEVKNLAYKQDIDSYQDLSYFINRRQKNTRSFQQILEDLLKETHSVFEYTSLFQPEYTSTTLYNKGSPY